MLVFTRHFKREIEELGKFEEFVLYVLENGVHTRISKRQSKYQVLQSYRRRAVRLIYVVHEDSIILIHIKPIKRK